MIDKFTLGHYLYNARKLRKTAADPFDFSQWGAVQRSYDPHYRPPRDANDPNDPEFRYKQAIWDKRNNLSPEAHTRAIKDNLYYDADHDLNFNSTAEGNSDTYKISKDDWYGTGPALMEGMKALSAGKGLDDATPREYQNIFGWSRYPLNRAMIWTGMPMWELGSMVGEKIAPGINFKNYPKLSGIAQFVTPYVTGYYADKLGHKGLALANKVAPKVMGSKLVTGAGNLMRGIGRGAGIANVAAQNLYQLSKSYRQNRDEIASKGAYIRSLGKGNSLGAGWSRVGASFVNGLKVGGDVMGTGLALIGGNPLAASMLTNGSALQTVRGYIDAFSNTGRNAQQRSLQSAVFLDQLKSMGGFDWFGGGKLDEGMLEQRGFERKLNQGYFDSGRLNAFRQSLRASGMSAGEIARKVEETRAAMPLFFNSGISEADRYKSTDRLYLDGASQARADAAKK